MKSGLRARCDGPTCSCRLSKLRSSILSHVFRWTIPSRKQGCSALHGLGHTLRYSSLSTKKFKHRHRTETCVQVSVEGFAIHALLCPLHSQLNVGIQSAEDEEANANTLGGGDLALRVIPSAL